jgi:hypothetical protein
MSEEEKKAKAAPGFLDDGRPFYYVAEHEGRYAVIGPHVVVGGFPDSHGAHGWLLEFFDNNARRSEDFAQERADRDARLAIEREEMHLRVLMSPTKH